MVVMQMQNREECFGVSLLQLFLNSLQLSFCPLKMVKLLLCLILVFVNFEIFTAIDMQKQDRRSLTHFKMSLQKSQVLSAWNKTNGHCHWLGVNCRHGRVVSLVLPTQSLKGPISPFLFNLSSLRVLDLSHNLLFGQLSSQICNLKRLKMLSLGENQLAGSVPSQLGMLTRLETLFLYSNSFTGEIPPQLRDLKQLKSLDLSDNGLNGTVPSQLGMLTQLQFLSLSDNRLSGSIPAELGNCKNLKTLILSFNTLSGSLPKELSKLPILYFEAEANQLSGPLPSWLAKWNQMDSLWLNRNQFDGRIPTEIGNCSMLKNIGLSYNFLSGSIPRELCYSEALVEIDLSGNLLSGTIKDVFDKCSNLTLLVLFGNHISGSIPAYLSQLPLMGLDLHSNNFIGVVPVSLWNSEKLIEFSAADNLLEGSLPRRIGNAVALERLFLNKNVLKGPVPKEIGNLTALEVLNLNSNFFDGFIPIELGDCLSLTTLDLGNNNLNGSIPKKISNLTQLQFLDLSHNYLSGPIPSKPSSYFQKLNIPFKSFSQHHGVFDMSYNRLSGPIPEELGSCVVVVYLLLCSNMLSGKILGSLSGLPNLTTLDLSGNLLTGPIPPEFGDSLKLQGLYLGNNQLTGSIPGTLGYLSSLVKLNLTGNKLSGSVPTSFGNLNGLTHLDLSYNELDGELPSSLSYILGIVGLYVQSNKLSGSVDKLFVNSVAWKIAIMNLSNNLFHGDLPWSLGNLPYLTSMDFHLNKFTGEIPPDFSNLVQLEYLDFSTNMLSGHIPEKICSLPNLLYLNLADNRLEGEVPTSGICQNLSIISLTGNKDLCGKIMSSNCQDSTSGKLVLAGIVVGSALAIAIIVFVLRWWIQRSRQSDPEETEESKRNSIPDQNRKSISDHSSSPLMEHLGINLAIFEPSLRKLTYDQIVAGTNKFCEENVIGGGGFGTVFKGTMPDGKTVAVKKLSQSTGQGDREFAAEMETLGMVKHQNLVQLLGYCSVGEEKLLVYEYMVKGSLDDWLRNQAASLDWGKRCKIACGAARGVAFLHHGFQPHIIHRDIKASNILLNHDFDAKVSDFGLARLISDCETHVSTDVAGTIGYVPPEYGLAGKATERGDVYSFGVILLELVTGKQPTGPEFEDKDGGNLVDWVLQMMKKEQADEVLDPTVLDANSKPMMLKMLQIAVGCVADNPTVRPTMLHVQEFLENIMLEEPLEEIKIERGESSGTKDI